jgi:AcrR family transcriptional regulator
MPVPETRQDRRKARTRARILDAAAPLLSAEPETATIERIADAADVAVATVYQHFAGKGDLRLAVLERALAENERHMLAVYGSDAAPVEKLVDAAGAYLRFYLDAPQLFGLIALPRASAPGDRPARPCAATVAGRVELMTQALASVIGQAIGEGSLHPVEPLAAARFLWGMMNGVIALALRPDPLRLTEAEMCAALRQGTEILFTGIVTDTWRDATGRLAPQLRDRLHSAMSQAGGDSGSSAR